MTKAREQDSWTNAFILLRLPFSLFLMPVYWLALAHSHTIDTGKAILVFIVLHLLVYPASNAYNSSQDRDEGSIGGLKNPPRAGKKLLLLVYVFDLLSLLLALLAGLNFMLFVLVYLLVSKAYSYRGIRLKKYPILSTLVVTFFQGAFLCVAIQEALGNDLKSLLSIPALSVAALSSLFLLGSYPMTQIYQHREDADRGDVTLSLLLGVRGTFLFTALAFSLALALMFVTYTGTGEMYRLYIFMLCTVPVLAFFFYWMRRAFLHADEVNFENTMRLNMISSLCLSLAFMLMLFAY